MVEPDGGGANALPRVARARPANAGRSLAAVKKCPGQRAGGTARCRHPGLSGIQAQPNGLRFYIRNRALALSGIALAAINFMTRRLARSVGSLSEKIQPIKWVDRGRLLLAQPTLELHIILHALQVLLHVRNVAAQLLFKVVQMGLQRLRRHAAK